MGVAYAKAQGAFQLGYESGEEWCAVSGTVRPAVDVIDGPYRWLPDASNDDRCVSLPPRSYSLVNWLVFSIIASFYQVKRTSIKPSNATFFLCRDDLPVIRAQAFGFLASLCESNLICD